MMVGIQELLSFADLCVKIMHVVSFSVCSCFDRRRKNLSAKFNSKSSIALWVDQMHLHISYIIVVEHLIKGTIEFTSMQRLIAVSNACFVYLQYICNFKNGQSLLKPSLNVFSM